MQDSEMRCCLFIARNNKYPSTICELLNKLNDCACRFLNCGDYSRKHFTAPRQMTEFNPSMNCCCKPAGENSVSYARRTRTPSSSCNAVSLFNCASEASNA